MIIQQPVTSASGNNGQQSASISAPQDDRFSTELKKKLSADKPQQADEKAPQPQEIKKKPGTKELKLADLQGDTAQLNPLPAAIAPDNTLPLPPAVPVTLPQELLPQDPALQASQQAGQQEISAVQDPAALVAAAPGSELSGEMSADIPQSRATLLSDTLPKLPPQESGVSPLATALHITKPAAAKTAEMPVEKPVTAESAEAAKTAEAAAQPVITSENVAAKPHSALTAEPIQYAHPAHVSTPVSQPVTGVPGDKVVTGALQAEVGTPAWQQSLGQQIAVFTRDGVHHAELRLHPEDLGSLQISLRLNNDQAQLHFVTADHQVRAALESAMPHLRTQLQESGIQLGQSSVGAESFSSTGDAPSGEHSGQGKSEKESSEMAVSAAEERISAPRTLIYSSGINTFA
jgi:flagellar hook-length control protein FliK